jgi:hypothetical protein
MNILDNLKEEFNHHIAFREKRPGIVQVIAPLFHEDGDMIEMFIALPKSASEKIRISDHGMTLMRLSYSYDVETPTKRKILDRILSENGVGEDRGRFFMETTSEHLYPSLLQFAQTVAKVSNMQVFKREIIHSLFYETLNDFVSSTLGKYQPEKNYLPIPTKDELEVDWRLKTQPRNIFLYGVTDKSKARLAALACLEFQKIEIPFRSLIVHEDFEGALSRKDQTRITNVADKQFTSLADFTLHAELYLTRETAGPIQ